MLLVEDEFLVRSALADGLRDDGFEVVEAATGDEAIQLMAARADFDLLCTDVRMPGKADGIDVAMSARGRQPRLPVLVISGYASELGRRLGALEPPTAFVPKPFTMDQISTTMRRLLSH